MQNCYDINKNNVEVENNLWDKVWSSKIHEKVKKKNLWRLLANVLPTQDILNRRFQVGDVGCEICGDERESMLHLVKDCPGFRALAFTSLFFFGGGWFG